MANAQERFGGQKRFCWEGRCLQRLEGCQGVSQVKGTLVAGDSAPGRGPGLCDDQKQGQGSQGGLRGRDQVGTAAEARLQTWRPWRAQALALLVNSKSSKTEVSLDICLQEARGRVPCTPSMTTPKARGRSPSWEVNTGKGSSGPPGPPPRANSETGSPQPALPADGQRGGWWIPQVRREGWGSGLGPGVYSGL